MKFKASSCIVLLSLVLNTITPNITFGNSNILYEDKNIQTVTSGVTYQKINRLYSSGWKDIHILTIDTKNPNIKLDVLESKTEYGLKKSTENLVKENNAIAGINGDFFSSGNPRSAMGQVIRNGKIDETTNYYNSSSNQYAGIFLDNFGDAFVDYAKSNLRLYNSRVNLELGAKNKITDFKKPVIFDKAAIFSTSDLDRRNPNLFKVVVENNIIKQKLGMGQVATVPENGYVIVMNKDTASANLGNFVINEPITFTETYNFVFRPNKSASEILIGMSAGGEILRNGNIISQGYSTGPKVRHPRTAVGVSKDKSKLILMVVDGRGVSIGATQQEVAQLMLEFGAYDAINFDGGGSSTMVVREEGNQEVALVNKVSESTQRSIPNVLGIKTTNLTGEISSLKISPILEENQSIISSLTYQLKVSAFDENLNPVNIDDNLLNISFLNSEDGTINGKSFTPSKFGTLTLKADYNGISTQINIDVKEPPMAISPKATKTSLKIGDSSKLSAVGVNKDGYETYIDPNQISWTVDNSDIGDIYGNVFTAKNNGLATLTGTYKEFTASIEIAVGEQPILIENFEQPKEMSMLYYPQNSGISGGSAISNIGYDGNSLILSYSFKENIKGSQATYVSFEKNPIIFTDKPNYIQLVVKGDSSNNMLKAVIKDKNDKQYIVPIIENMSSSEWITTRIEVPADVEYPIRIDKIYVGTLDATKKNYGSVYIDNIEGIVSRTDGGAIIGGYVDPLSSNELLYNAPYYDEEDINVFGQTQIKKHPNSMQVLQDTINIMKNNSVCMVFVGDSNIEGIATDVPTIQWQNKYYTTQTKNLSIINLATKSGNILKENPEQWRWLQSYLENFSKNNILINMDKNIWDSKNNLKGARENILFHKILKNFVQETNKNVIVVSATEDKSNVYVKDGIRYINLNGLTSESPTDLSNYKYLKIRATETDLKYQLLNIYN